MTITYRITIDMFFADGIGDVFILSTRKESICEVHFDVYVPMDVSLIDAQNAINRAKENINAHSSKI